MGRKPRAEAAGGNRGRKPRANQPVHGAGTWDVDHEVDSAAHLAHQAWLTTMTVRRAHPSLCIRQTSPRIRRPRRRPRSRRNLSTGDEKPHGSAWSHGRGSTCQAAGSIMRGKSTIGLRQFLLFPQLVRAELSSRSGRDGRNMIGNRTETSPRGPVAGADSGVRSHDDSISIAPIRSRRGLARISIPAVPFRISRHFDRESRSRDGGSRRIFSSYPLWLLSLATKGLTRRASRVAQQEDP